MKSQSFSGLFPIYKERTETLAVLLDRFRTEHNLGDDIKLTYAGRLDPMAEGLVLVLAGDTRFEKDSLLGLRKTYIVDILLGIATDTLDPLGLITAIDVKDISQVEVEEVVTKMTAIKELSYPLYSSVPVEGKPLFIHAREGNTVEVPMKNVVIYSAELLGIKKENFKVIADRTIEDIAKVAGDFRQAETIEGWQKIKTVQGERAVTIVRIQVEVSSGTYMRSLAEWFGDQLGVAAITYGINRTKLGEYEIKSHSKKSGSN